MPHFEVSHESDPREQLLSAVGDLSKLRVLHNNVIVAVYLRPNRTKSGLYLTEQHVGEDRFQSKVGCVVAIAPGAFHDADGAWNWGDIKIGDWVVFRPSDGWNLSLRGEGGHKDGVLCRRLADTSIEAVVDDPDMVF